jgi:predicted DCC family thiol-disulfide oxidoreductase YuxK
LKRAGTLDPAAFENVALILYDGDCGICEAIIARLRHSSATAQLLYLPSQDFCDAELRALGVSRETLQKTIAVRTRRFVLRGAPAFNYIMWHTRGFRWLSGIAIAFPPLLILESVLYRVVARNRGRLSAFLGLRACRRQHAPGRPVSWQEGGAPR